MFSINIYDLISYLSIVQFLSICVLDSPQGSGAHPLEQHQQLRGFRRRHPPAGEPDGAGGVPLPGGELVPVRPRPTDAVRADQQPQPDQGGLPRHPHHLRHHGLARQDRGPGRAQQRRGQPRQQLPAAGAQHPPHPGQQPARPRPALLTPEPDPLEPVRAEPGQDPAGHHQAQHQRHLVHHRGPAHRPHLQGPARDHPPEAAPELPREFAVRVERGQ